MLSTIWAGATNASDVFFLIATILAGLATIIRIVPDFPDRFAGILMAGAVTFLSIGFLAL